jgi:hypothetical protein
MTMTRRDKSTKKSARLVSNMEKARAVMLRATGYDRSRYDGNQGAEEEQ